MRLRTESIVDNITSIKHNGGEMNEEVFSFINQFVQENDYIKRDITKEDGLKNDIGLDSLGVLTLADALEEEFEISIEFEDLTETPETVNDLIKLIEQKKEA